MSQGRGTSGHLKGKYDSHSSCLNCSACSRFNRCVECHLWSDSIWDLADNRRSFSSRQMGKKKESKEKKQKGFSSRCSSSLRPGLEQTASQDDPTRSSVFSHDDDSLSGDIAPALSQSLSGGVINDSETAQFPVNDHTETRVRRLTWSDQEPTVPSPPDPTPGIWLVSMGFRLRPLT